MVLFEFAFEARQERKSVGRGPGETGENAIVIKPADFFGARFHDRFAESYLTIAR
jgi:hypothetical protein